MRFELLQESPTVTRCAYKGTARHWSAHTSGEVVDDVAWSHEHVRREGEPVQHLVAFYDELVDVEIDGDPQDRPATRWSR